MQWHMSLGPISVLIVGKVWAVDIGRFGIYGIGWRHIRTRRVAR